MFLHNWFDDKNRKKNIIVHIACCISIIKNRRIPSENPLSKDSNHVPWRVSDVFVDSEDEHEHEEEASAAKEVPDVVIVPDINNSW